MFNIGPQELILILVVALVVVGPRRLPEIGRSLGKGLREMRKAQDEVRKTIQVNLEDIETPAPKRKRAAGPSSPESPSGSDGSPGPAEGLAAATGAAAEPVREVSRTLGRGLSELRKAREEIQRSFRVDPYEPSPRPGASVKPPDVDPPPAPDGDGGGVPDQGSPPD